MFKLKLLLMVLVCSTGVFASYINASIIDSSTDVIQDVYYYAAGGGYGDFIGTTPQVYIRVCADTSGELSGGKGVAAFYVIDSTNNSNNADYHILGGNDTSQGYAYFMAPFADGAKYCADANFDFYTSLAKYPAKVFGVVDVNGNRGSSIDFGTDALIPIPSTMGYLPYGFTRAAVQSSYDQVTGNITIDATGTSPSVSGTSYLALMVGSCDDDQGVTCDGAKRTTVDASGVSVYTGVVAPADSVMYTKYSVINGYGESYCIGPDVDVTSVAVAPSVGPIGTLVNLTATVANVNTVNITTSFIVQFWAQGVNVCNGTLTQPLGAGDSKASSTCTWNSAGFATGSTSIIGSPRYDLVSIKDCNHANDNGTGTFTTETVWYANVWIDNNLSTTFYDAGKPYNLTVKINNSDGLNPPVEVRFVEENGMTIMAPAQIYNLSVGKSGVKARSIASVQTDSTGYVNFTVVPTGTKLYSSEYSYLDLASYVGNHSIYLEIFNNDTGVELQLYYDGAKQDKLSFTLSNLTPRDPLSSEQGINVFNKNSFVSEALNLAYRSLAVAVKWLR